MKTIKLFDVKNHNGDVIGYFIRDISAREGLDMRIMRKLFKDHIKNSKNTFRTPIFNDGTISINIGKNK